MNPFYLARRGLAQEIRRAAGVVQGRVLDVGCGSKPYRTLFDTTSYFGLEVETLGRGAGKSADVLYDGLALPFCGRSFDSIVLFQVLEHVFHPEELLLEVRRVLRPGGALLLTVPFVWDEHEQPWDFARYSSFGLRALLERNGFEVVSVRKTVPDVGVLFQLANAYLYKKTLTRNRFVNLGVTMVTMAPLNALGLLLSYVLPPNEDLYLDNVVVARGAMAPS